MDRVPKKGDVFYIESDPNKAPIGSEMWSDRPAIIVSNNANNENSNIVQIVYLTNSHRKRISPMHVLIKSCGEKSIAMCEQIYTVDKTRLKKYIQSINNEEIEEINKAIAFCLALDEVNCSSVFRKWSNYIIKNKININLEQEHLIETTENQAIKQLRNEVEILRKEKESYKTLASINEERYKNLLKERK